MTDNGHQIRLTDAEEGVPTRAECECGWVWERPPKDRYADTLPTAARAHLRGVDG